MELNNNEIMIYEDKDGITKVNVKFINEDLWITQNQLAEIYKTTQQNISLHIKSIYRDKELKEDSTNKKFLLVQNEGGRSVKKIKRRKMKDWTDYQNRTYNNDVCEFLVYFIKNYKIQKILNSYGIRYIIL